MTTWTQARCARATLTAFRIIGIEPTRDTGLFLAVAQLLHLAATRTSADMDRACALAIVAEEITTGDKPPKVLHDALGEIKWDQP